MLHAEAQDPQTTPKLRMAISTPAAATESLGWNSKIENFAKNHDQQC